MARKKADSKFLTDEELNKFSAKLEARRGKKYFTFVSGVMGTAYGTVRNKFLKRRVEIAIKENIDRFFENEDLKIENSELKERLARVKQI